MQYGKQVAFCNNCGKRIYSEFNKIIGKDFRTCSLNCNDEIQLKDARSNLGESIEDPAVIEQERFEKLLAECNKLMTPGHYPPPQRLMKEGCRGYVAEPRHFVGHEWKVNDRNWYCTLCNQDFHDCEYYCPFSTRSPLKLSEIKVSEKTQKIVDKMTCSPSLPSWGTFQIIFSLLGLVILYCLCVGVHILFG